MVADESPQAAPRGTLSASESAELAAGLAELTKIGLPLPAGLRALAEEWPSRRLRPVLLRLANKVEQGTSLEEALLGPGTRLPAHLRGVIVAGVRSGRLAEALEKIVVLQRTQVELRRRVWLSLAYPTLLMIIMCILAFLARYYILAGMTKIFRDFGTNLPVITELVMGTSGIFICLLIALTALMLVIPLLLAGFPGSAWLLPALYPLPLLGPILKSSETARFCRMMEMLLSQQVPLPEALRLSAQGLDDAYLIRACRKAAVEVEKGRPISESMVGRRKFSRSLLPLVRWGERLSMLPDAFQAGAEMFEGRAASQGRSLEIFLLPVTFLLIIVFYGIFILAVFMPLISLITRLTGGH
jgi:type II secretory pathway component PulF